MEVYKQHKKQIMLSNILYISSYILYPFTYIYLRFFRLIINKSCGLYIKSRIKNKGIDLRIHGLIDITDIDQFSIGDYCRIGVGAFLFCKGGLKIGNNVQISRNLTIYTANHNYNSNILPYDNNYICKSVEIKDNVWIGMNVSILPGVTIGKNVIIGMGAVITKSIPDNAIVVGENEIIKYREFAENENYKFFGEVYPNS